MTNDNEKKIPNPKLMIWFGGTTETKNDIQSSLKVFKTKDPNIKITIIDGVATRKDRALSNRMRNDKGLNGSLRKIGNLTGNTVGIAKDFFGGYEEASHLVLQNEAIKAIHTHMEEYPDAKSDLIVGGFSRGAEVGLPAFLGSLSEASKTRDLQKKETKDNNDIEQTSVDGGKLFKEYFEKISIIAVDPVLGLKKQDTFGLNPVENQKKPLKEIFETLKQELAIPMDITFMPTKYAMLKGLSGGEQWNELVKDAPKDLKIKVLQAGTNHIAMTNPLLKGPYDKEATPIKLLNRVVEEKLENVPEGAMSSEIMQEKVAQRDNEILKNIAFGPKITKKRELKGTLARGAVKLLHGLGRSQGEIFNLKKELIKQLENPEAPKVIAGRSLDADKDLGLELNNKGKLVVKPALLQQNGENQGSHSSKIDFSNMGKNQIKKVSNTNTKNNVFAIQKINEHKAQKTTKGVRPR